MSKLTIFIGACRKRFKLLKVETKTSIKFAILIIAFIISDVFYSYFLITIPIFLILFCILEIHTIISFIKNKINPLFFTILQLIVFPVLILYITSGGFIKTELRTRILAPYEARKCAKIGYPGDRPGGPYIKDPYMCIWSGFLDGWTGAVYMPHEGWNKADEPILIRNKYLNTGSRMYCYEIDSEWLWCEGN